MKLTRAMLGAQWIIAARRASERCSVWPKWNINVWYFNVWYFIWALKSHFAPSSAVGFLCPVSVQQTNAGVCCPVPGFTTLLSKCHCGYQWFIASPCKGSSTRSDSEWRLDLEGWSPCWSSGNHSRRLFRRQSKIMTAKSMSELMWPWILCPT